MRKTREKRAMGIMLNSEEYWNHRFETDWKEYSGNEQTRFFASVLKDMLPEWLINEVTKEDIVCDLGCAEGDALPIYKQIFSAAQIKGEDISKKAVTEAKLRYPEFDFRVGNILKPENEEKYSVVICSNVVEHFKDTYIVLSCICERATKYAVILLPYCEIQGKIEEHESVFHTCDIPVRVSGSYLAYARAVACNSILYPGEQLLLVYAKDEHFAMLSALCENVRTDAYRALDEHQKRQAKEYETQIEEYRCQIKEQDRKLSDGQGRLANMEECLEDYKMQVKNLEIQICNDIERDKIRLTELKDAKEKLSGIMEELYVKDRKLMQIQELCDLYATGKLMRLNHLCVRIKGQLFRGDKKEKRKFWKWFTGRNRKTKQGREEEVIYNPWLLVREKIEEALMHGE